ncbi:hypothetical protein VY88_04755 [Azospirillum thiophilum]|uniref:PRC-barrel domain-containing protein n=1 Tax=Azospirillum thiophilum TaxID=528244 RepID=A0AAC9EXC3_9PROT|nr:hypothetical protein [Azospirillum thiophilum]ALG70856.1 hypothetical protein AL072_07950 [Azospirillum thiophilum]KJR67103.1 hypothetical protein VY88_04755 [Azospirillum thiophilum]
MRFQTMLASLALAATLPFVHAESALAADPRAADDLVGIEVTGLLGEELGQIVSVSPATNGKGDAVLVEASGMLDVGHRFFTVHRSQLSPGEDVDTVTYKKTAQDVIRRLHTDTQVAER